MKAMSPLFDRIDRSDATPSDYQESIFDGLNRLAWKNAEKIRNLLDEWFADYPVDYQKELRGRFRSPRNSDHQGAFFELFVHRLLIDLGFKVEVNPLTHRSNTPDFLAETTSREKFYLDARVVEPQTLKNSPREERVFDELNKLHSPDFLLASMVRGELHSNPPLKRIRETFQAWIDQLHYEMVKDCHTGLSGKFSKSFEHDGWTLTLDPLVRLEHLRGTPNPRPFIPPPSADFVDSTIPIIQAVREKARRYRNLGSHLVVAVNALDLAGVDRSDILKALFGWAEVMEGGASAKITPTPGIRRADCIWSATKNTGVSAILLFNELQTNSIANAPVCLYENPWSSHSIPSFLRRVPRGIVDGEMIRWRTGESLRSVLGLPEHWPGPK
jgi:hypothetical protein